MKLFFLIFFFISFSASADSVRIFDLINTKSLTGSIAGTDVSLNFDPPSGDATADSAPARVYIPIQNGDANQIKYSVLSKTNAATSLYNITLGAHTVSFPLMLTIGGTAKRIYLAVRGGASGTSYFVSARTPTTYSNISSFHLDFSISPFIICKSVILNNISTVCNAAGGALSPTSTTNVLYKPMLYFFATDQDLAVDGSTSIDPANANYSGGVYFEAQMSNRVYTSTALIVSLSDLRKGDQRLIGTYSANSGMDTTLFKNVVAYSYTDTSTAIVTNEILGNAAPGSLLPNELGTAQSGEFTLNNLMNSQPYKISVAFVDKFKFATTLSFSKTGTPTAIEELLKKQACFILTAGFGEEHFVTNYFRSYRDHILANSWFGRKLIKVYYRTAPRYALFIYRHETIRLGIRSFAYVLYFLFNYGVLLLIFLAAFVYLNILRKNKIILRKDSL